MSEGTTWETTMRDEEDVNLRMDQLRDTMKNATRSLEIFCEANGLLPRAWFEALEMRMSTSRKTPATERAESAPAGFSDGTPDHESADISRDHGLEAFPIVIDRSANARPGQE